jgi:hypothetical protein
VEVHVKCIASASLSVLLPALACAGQWHSDYREALNRAKAEDKPLLVCFRAGDPLRASEERFEKFGALADHFILIHADKSTPEGKELFRLFEITGENACVVVERTQQWQFCRYERKLDDSELRTLLSKASRASGKPDTDLLEMESMQKTRSIFSSSAVSCPS